MLLNRVIEGYLKAFGGMYMYITMHSPEQDYYSFTAQICNVINNYIYIKMMKTSKCIIEHVSFNRIISTLQEVVLGMLKHVKQIT